MRTYTASGIVLHRTLLGEADKILTLFTREHGKISAVAKGSRRPSSRLSGVTELFTDAKYLMSRGRSLDVISQCEIVHSYPALRLNLELIARATYLCELLDRMTMPHDATAAESIHTLTSLALMVLERADGYPDGVLHSYELHLLKELGYEPNLDKCSVCGRPAESRSSAFSAMQGGLLCSEDRLRARDSCAVSSDAIELLRILRDSDIEQILTIRPVTRIAIEIDRILRPYIALRLDRPLKSADFLEEIRSQSR